MTHAVQHELAVGQGNSLALRPLVESGVTLLSCSEPVSLLPCRRSSIRYTDGTDVRAGLWAPVDLHLLKQLTDTTLPIEHGASNQLPATPLCQRCLGNLPSNS